MNGRKAKALCRARRADEEANRMLRASITAMDAAPFIPGDFLVSYLTVKFVGKSGYRFVSVGRSGSLFMNEKSSDIVSVAFHCDQPVISVRGRYNDPLRRDLQFDAFHVPAGFPGMVIDNHANVYLAGSANPATKEELDAVLFKDGAPLQFKKVTKEEFKDALELEKPLIEEQLQKIQDAVKDTAAKGREAMKALNDKMRKDGVESAIGRPLTDEEAARALDECLVILKERGYTSNEDCSVVTDKDGHTLSNEEMGKLEVEIYQEVRSRLHLDDAPVVESTEETPVGYTVIDRDAVSITE